MVEKWQEQRGWSCLEGRREEEVEEEGKEEGEAKMI